MSNEGMELEIFSLKVSKLIMEGKLGPIDALKGLNMVQHAILDALDRSALVTSNIREVSDDELAAIRAHVSINKGPNTESILKALDSEAARRKAVRAEMEKPVEKTEPTMEAG